MTTLFPIGERVTATCAICGRPLRDPVSVARSLGPVCCPAPPKPRPVADHPVLPGFDEKAREAAQRVMNASDYGWATAESVKRDGDVVTIRLRLVADYDELFGSLEEHAALVREVRMGNMDALPRLREVRARLLAGNEVLRTAVAMREVGISQLLKESE